MADLAAQPAPATRAQAFPARIIGRTDALTRIAQKLSQHRFVTLVGPGGMGKTTVARACAAELGAAYRDGVFLVELAPLATAELVPAALLSAFSMVDGPGRPNAPGDGLARVAVFLERRQCLVVLDGCEHLLEAMAAAVESMRAASPGLCILATSREALRADGEWVHHLAAMSLPAAGIALTRGTALAHSAVQLFVERARRAQPDFDITESQAPLIGELCRHLDGIPLALELAAARISLLGLEGLATQIGDRLGWRDDSAPPQERRHRTLAQTLDWSYDLLADVEQRVLRRLAVFGSGFSLEAARAVVSDEALAPDEMTDIVFELLAKSLLARIDEPAAERRSGERYRLLDTTRAYAHGKLQADDDIAAVERRHVRFLCDLLEKADRDWDVMTRANWLKEYAPWIDDIRATLDREPCTGTDIACKVELTLGAFKLARQLSIEFEFKPRLEAAGRLLRKLARPQALLEIRLASCLSTVSHCPGALEMAQLDALEASLAQGDRIAPGALSSALPSSPSSQFATLASAIGIMAGHWGGAAFRADSAGMNEWFGRIDRLARRSDDWVAMLTADRIRAQMLHFGGAHAMAERVARRVLDRPRLRIPLAYNPSPIDLRVSMRIVLARSLWMQGWPTRAQRVIDEGMRLAREDSPLAHCQMVAMGALPIALWNGNAAACDGLLTLLRERASQCSIGHWRLWADALAAVAQRRLAPFSGAEAAPVGHGEIHDQSLLDHLCTLDGGYVTAMQVERVQSGEAVWCAPEVLRVLALKKLASGPDTHGAQEALQAHSEALLRRALRLANAQTSLAWELRASTSLARLLMSAQREAEAGAVLHAVLRRFKEDSGTRDLVEAKSLMAELRVG